ncbi:MAG: biliverdin-producing heme oxygenase [Bradyrhizobium sp.]|jgi:heme oxygenase (biliverdin-IX-beta and delta-forming)|uniref:biliverdin-producing heme oxygenase n=1 Tax=Bradyrhizobium sp. TaxID=376 RepID=UPI003C7D2370
MLLAPVSVDHPHAGNAVGIRDKLKAATAVAHHALDERLSGFDLTARAHYRRFLQASAAALLPLEAALRKAGVAAMFEDWPLRTRSTAITADLNQLGGTVNLLPVPSEPLGRCGVLGTLYVLEGSRLGAAYLMRVAAASADPRVRAATRYLCHGSGQGLWRGFLDRLEREPMSADDERTTIVSAQQAFALFAKAVEAA